MNLKIIILAVLFVLAGAGQVSGVGISSCTDITSSGTYTLTQDILNSNAIICINITPSNVIFDGQGYMIDGVDASNTQGIYVYNTSTLTNVTLKNITITDWYNGIYYRNSGNGRITNYTALSNAVGIYLDHSNDNILANSTVSNNGNGINFYGSSGNIITNNTITNNDDGLNSRSSSSPSIYNNYFNNTNNFNFLFSINDWNTTKTLGTNIGGGPYLGGNFWAYPNGTGFSETCTDANSDGFCDSNYALATGNVDYLPLSLNFTANTSSLIINITSPPNATINDTTPDLNFTISELANTTYTWNNEDNITGCQNCTSYNTTYGEATPDANTSLLLHFNENFGNTTYDDSPNDNDGTILGPAWTLYGRFGNALSFDGVDDFVRVPYDSSLNIANTLTFGAWIYPDYDSPPSKPGPFFITKNKGYAIGIPDGKIKTFLYINGKWVGHRSNTSVPMRQWSHVFVTYNGTTVKMYLNGTQIYSGPRTGDIDTANTKELKVGWCGGTSHKRFRGTIDEVQVFDRVLNASEVVEYYNASLIPGPHSVTVYAKDESNNRNSTTRWFSVAYS